MNSTMMIKTALISAWAASPAPVLAQAGGQVNLSDLTQWGVAGVIIAYVFWRDRERERRMNERLDESERFIRDKLIHAIDKNTDAMQILHSRPCLIQTTIEKEQK